MTSAPITGPRPLRRQATLRAQAMRGDAGAFSEIYRRHHQALYRYAITIVRNPDDAADVLQSTMTKAFVALQKEKRDFELLPWLFRIVHNESISFLRRRRPTADIEQAERIGEDNLTQSVDDRASLAQLQVDLADLGQRQRAALVMRELSGLTHEEIGTALGCSTAAAKQAIFEARKGLSEMSEGREMECEPIQRALSDADGRVLRNRRIRAHLRDCQICAGFSAALSSRPRDLAAISPALPAFGAATILTNVLAGGQAAGAASGIAAGAGGVAAGGAVGKSLAVVAATAALAGGAVTATKVANNDQTAPAGTTIPAKTAPAAAAGGIPGLRESQRTRTTTDKPAGTTRTTSPRPAASPAAKAPKRETGKATAPGQLKADGEKATGKGIANAPGQQKTKTTPPQVPNGQTSTAKGKPPDSP